MRETEPSKEKATPAASDKVQITMKVTPVFLHDIFYKLQ